MRLLVAVGLWVLFFAAYYVVSIPYPPMILADAADTLIAAMLVGIIFTIIRVGVREFGVKWYYIFALMIPLYNLYVFGRVFWYWAGRITGARPIQPEVGAVSNRP